MLRHLIRLLRRPEAATDISALYRAIVAQARLPVFYQALGVPDTVDGRFDLLLLHVLLVMRCLPDAARQSLFDLLFLDMDRNLREMGVGDMSVGKRIKPMLEAFYGRAKAYEAALADGEGALAAALGRNLYRNVSADAATQCRMAVYVQRSVAALESQADAALLSGQVEFATPVA